jgi:citrate lyase subunit beta/citryl-CoA lyase
MPQNRNAEAKTGMRLRSLLFVPGDRPERFDKAIASGADAVIIDLEDSVAIANKEKARANALEFMSRRSQDLPILVRINPITSAALKHDLATVAQAKPFAILLPKAEGAASVEALAAQLQHAGGASTPILPIATETPAAIFQLASYTAVKELICGLTWGAEDLPAAIGATTSREEDGTYTAPYEMARSLTLFAAHAASVQAIETVYPDFHDLDGLRKYSQRGRRDGFTGMMAIHPDQVAVINDAFTPDAAAIVWAERVVEAFHANPNAGVIQLDGRMLDLPHLKMATGILAAAKNR